jgi:Neprosin
MTEMGRIERNPEAPEPVQATRSGRDLDREAAGQLDEIRQYFQDRYARREIVAHTTTALGEELDWVPAESQVAGALAEPPELPPPDYPRDPARPAEPAIDISGSRMEAGPSGTVPLPRKPVEQIRPTGNLQDYLAKGIRQKIITPPDDPSPAPPSATATVHKYAHAYQPVANFGTEGTINTWKPYVQWSNEFSLGQLWVVRGSGTGLQTCEVGVQTYNDIYGDWNPHLFIFYTTNGYTQGGPNLGGYNTDVAGWVQVATQVYPAMRVAESVLGGDQYDITLKVTLYQGNWWVLVGDQWMGYYPATLYNSAGLRDGAASVDWGGEIVDDGDTHPEPTATAMGSGHFPAEGWQHAAYMRNLAYQADTAGTMNPIQGYPSVTNPAAYQIAADFSGSSSWGSDFFWGGPGGVA